MFLLLGGQSLAQSVAVPSLPPGTPAWVGPTWRSSLLVPRSSSGQRDAGAATALAATSGTSPEGIYDSGRIPGVVGRSERDANATGTNLSYQPAGAVATATNAFFQALGTNGRTCATCHQPPSGMSVSVANIQARYAATQGTDPLFASVDGATCPSNVTGPGQPASAFSLLLDRGVFRIFLSPPPDAEFAITVLRDPYGCNTDPLYNRDPATGAPIISVYRRPTIAANLAFITRTVPPSGTGPAPPPAIMWDERETSLEQQATDATLVHAQALTAPTAAQVRQIVSFESGIFSAQVQDSVALGLTAAGASGGPVALAGVQPGTDAPGLSITAYGSWSGQSGNPAAARRASIARGQALFTTRSFTIAKVGGLGTVSGATCTTCHREAGSASNTFGQSFAVDIGIGGIDAGFGLSPDPSLPLFRLTCRSGKSTQYNGSTVVTNDPGRALITGKCIDIEKFKVPQLRALASRAAYFSGGQAKSLTDVVLFYDQRLRLHLRPRDRQDLANFLAAL